MKNFLFLLVISLSLVLTSCQNYSSGERVGIVTKLSEKGAILKSFEIELKVAPAIAQNNQTMGSYETFFASIDNSDAIKCETPIDSIKSYISKGIPVIVQYQQVKYLNVLNNRGETDYFIKSITPANK